jgi:hypothetical protein
MSLAAHEKTDQWKQQLATTPNDALVIAQCNIYLHVNSTMQPGHFARENDK